MWAAEEVEEEEGTERVEDGGGQIERPGVPAMILGWKEGN